MPDETENKTVIVTQKEGERFAHEASGGLALYGDKKQPALQPHWASRSPFPILPAPIGGPI